MKRIMENWLIILFFLTIISLSIHENNRNFVVNEGETHNPIHYTIIQEEIDYSLNFE